MEPKDVVEKRKSDLGDFAPPEEELVRPVDTPSEAHDGIDEDLDDEEDDDPEDDDDRAGAL